jgi:hypothetical protein
LALTLHNVSVENEKLSKMLRAQGEYIDLLQKHGLHELLASHELKETLPPTRVAAALGDVASGLEPALASQLHGVPTDEIVSCLAVFTERLRKNQTQIKERELPPAANEHSTITSDAELLQRQLEFNALNSTARERANSLQIARLTEELNLERHATSRNLAET